MREEDGYEGDCLSKFEMLGRRLMERLLTRRSAKKLPPAAAPETEIQPVPESPEIALEKERLKAAKKQAKAETKRAKKAGD